MFTGTDFGGGCSTAVHQRDATNQIRAVAKEANYATIPTLDCSGMIRDERVRHLKALGMTNRQIAKVLVVTPERVTQILEEMDEHEGNWKTHYAHYQENPYASIHRLVLLEKPLSIKRICECLNINLPEARQLMKEAINLNWVRTATEDELEHFGVKASYAGKYFLPGSQAIIFNEPQNAFEYRGKSLRTLKVSRKCIVHLSWTYTFKISAKGAEEIRRWLRPKSPDDAADKMNVFSALLNAESASLKDAEERKQVPKLYNTGAVVGLVWGEFENVDDAVDELVVNPYEDNHSSFPIHAFLNDREFAHFSQLANPKGGKLKKEWIDLISRAQLETPDETEEQYTFVLAIGRF